MLRATRAGATFLLLVVVSGCAVWGESESDAIRYAIVRHELDRSGIRVDDLIIRLAPGEFRADFGRGSRIVWLVSTAYQRDHIEGEYFRVHDPKRSYLFVQDITYDGAHNQAVVTVVLHLGSGKPTAKELTLHNNDGTWEVISERELGGEEASE